MWRQFAGAGAARLRLALTELAVVAAIGLCLMAAAVLGLTALNVALRPLVGPVAAPALVGALMLIIALSLALWLSTRRNRRTRVLQVAVPQPVIGSAGPADGAPDLGTSAAFLAGFLLARRLF